MKIKQYIWRFISISVLKSASGGNMTSFLAHKSGSICGLLHRENSVETICRSWNALTSSAPADGVKFSFSFWRQGWRSRPQFSAASRGHLCASSGISNISLPPPIIYLLRQCICGETCLDLLNSDAQTDGPAADAAVIRLLQNIVHSHADAVY